VCFGRALEVARRQRARSLELRAATGLGRLWQAQGKSAASRDALVGIYGWFTEGFDTVDLQAARAVFEGVAPPDDTRRA
jgi:adenylate cyclase